MRYSYEIQYKSIYVQPIRFVISKKNVKIVENSTFHPLITDGTPQKPPLEHLYKLSGCIKYLRTWS